MIKWFKNLTKEGLQKLLFFGVLVLVIGVFILAFTLGGDKPQVEKPNDDKTEQPTKPGDDDPNKEPNENQDPVVEMFKSPCDLENYDVFRLYYSLDSATEEQEKAVIQFGSKYFLSRGISLKDPDDKEFDVLASMSGTVIEVSESPIYGVTVVIDHGDGFTSEYISLSKASVSVKDTVKQGQKIGVSGSNEYDAQASNHVHFKIAKDGVYYNPLDVLGKKKSEIK